MENFNGLALSRAMSAVSLVVTVAVFADVVVALAISTILEPVLLLLPLTVPGRAFRAAPRGRTRSITTLARGRAPVPCGVVPRSGVVVVLLLPPTNDFEKDGFILITRVGKLVCVPILEFPVDGRFYRIS